VYVWGASKCERDGWSAKSFQNRKVTGKVRRKGRVVEGVRGYTLRSVTDDVAAVNVAAAHVAAALVFAVADVEATVTSVLVGF